MTAWTANYFDGGRGLSAEDAQKNARILSEQQARRRGASPPEYHLPRHFDNSRLVKAADPARMRQIVFFSAAMTVLLSLLMIFGIQHVNAIEGDYRVEREKQVRDQLREENRELRLNEAQLAEPGRIDRLSRGMGMAEPQPGQVIHTGDADAAALAQAAPAQAATAEPPTQ